MKSVLSTQPCLRKRLGELLSTYVRMYRSGGICEGDGGSRTVAASKACERDQNLAIAQLSQRLPVSRQSVSHATYGTNPTHATDASRVASMVACLVSVAFFVACSVSLVGCVTYMPVDEYNIARTAFDAAKDADAPRYSPALWFSTEQAYHNGEKAFTERDFGNARRLFIDTRDFAEKAENAARLARHQSGDVVP